MSQGQWQVKKVVISPDISTVFEVLIILNYKMHLMQQQQKNNVAYWIHEQAAGLKSNHLVK